MNGFQKLLSAQSCFLGGLLTEKVNHIANTHTEQANSHTTNEFLPLPARPQPALCPNPTHPHCPTTDRQRKVNKKVQGILRKFATFDKKKRQAAYKELRDSYEESVNGIVPSAEAEKIMNGRLGRTFGYFSRGFTGNRRSGDRGRGGRGRGGGGD